MRRALCAIATVLTLSGCPGIDSTARGDKDRLAVMQAEPLLSQATKEPLAVAGFRVSDKLPLHRGQVVANILQENDADPPGSARKHTAETMAAMRDSGWTIYSTECVPQLKPGEPEPTAGPRPHEDWWLFLARGYKIADGVSYYAEVHGTGARFGRVTVDLVLRAPNSRESTSDLFSDRPPALASGSSCVEASQLPDATTVDGVPIVVDEHGPDPDGTPKPPGHR